MDGQGRPQSKLRVRQMQEPAERRKDQERDGIQNKDGSERNRHLFIAGLDNGSDSGNGAASADSGACGDQDRCGFVHAQQAAEQKPENQRKGDTGGGIEEAATADAQHFVQVHAKAQANDGGLQQESGKVAAIGLVRMDETQSVEQTERESQRRRNNAAGAQNEPNEKESLGIQLTFSNLCRFRSEE